jgi:hypothetical protein
VGARGVGEALHVGGEERVGVDHFRVLGEPVPVIDLQPQEVDAFGGQGVLN